MGFIRKIKGALVRLDSNKYVGEASYLFYDVDQSCLRISDGVTPGGLPACSDGGVYEYDSITDFPLAGKTDAIYIAADTNKIYRWTGTSYAELGRSSLLIADEGVIAQNSPHAILNFIGDYVSVSDAGNGIANVYISTPVFGTEYQIQESVGVTTTTSTEFLSKLQLTTPLLPSGTYRVALRYGWNHNSTSNDFEGRFTEDGNDIGEHHKQEPKDSSGSFSTTGTSQRYYYNNVFTRVLAAGQHTYDFSFRTDRAGTASSTWEVSIEIWRVV